MLLFSICVAGSNSFGKLIANDITPGALTAARFLLAAVILGAGVIITGKFKMHHYRAPLRYLPLIASYAAFFVFMFYALKTISPVSTSALFTLMPFLSAVLAWLFYRHSSPKSVWLALFVGAIGALWIVFNGNTGPLLRLDFGQGEVVYLIGLFAYAAYAVIVPVLSRGEPSYALTLAVLAGGAVILGVAFSLDILATNWAKLPPRVWLVLAYLAIIAGILTMWLMTIAAHRLPAAKVTAYTFLTPFWVILAEPIFGRPLPEISVLIGALPILAALLILFFEGGKYA